MVCKGDSSAIRFCYTFVGNRREFTTVCSEANTCLLDSRTPKPYDNWER